MLGTKLKNENSISRKVFFKKAINIQVARMAD